MYSNNIENWVVYTLLNDSKNNKKTKDEALHIKIRKIIKDKYNNAQTSDEKKYFSNQLSDLNKITNLYNESERTHITKISKEEIKKILNNLPKEVNLKKNLFTDEKIKLENIISNETNRLKDTIDIITTNTIRDLLENNIDIQWIKESSFSQEYQEFFDIATVIYIDILEEKKWGKLTENEEIDIISKWFKLGKDDKKTFYLKLKDALLKEKIDIDFDMKIANEEENINLKYYKEKIDSDKIIKKDTITELNEDQIEIEKIFIMNTRERIDYIKNLFDKRNFNNSLNLLIGNLEWINFNKIIKDTWIDKNIVLENLKTLLLFIIEVDNLIFFSKDSSLKEQINDFILWLSSETKKIDGKTIDDYLIKVLFWDTEAMKIIYSKYYNTKWEENKKLNYLFPKYSKLIKTEIHKFR